MIKGETWVLSDFGLCKFFEPEEERELTHVNEKVGPAFWMSPEAITSFYFGKDLIISLLKGGLHHGRNGSFF